MSDSEGQFAHLAQLVERKTFNLVVVGSSPTVGTWELGIMVITLFYLKILKEMWVRVPRLPHPL